MATPDRLKTAVGIMAKQPRAGKVKTRLAKDIGDVAALDIYNRLLQRIGTTIRSLDPEAYYRALCVTPAAAAGFFTMLFPGFDSIRVQQDGDLGDRMQAMLTELLALDMIGSALLVGTDIPEITAEHCRQAREALTDHDVVLGPTSDGGYYLIGMRTPHATLFDGPEWGTDTVLEQTLELAATAGLQVKQLETLRDLDTAADLTHFPSLARPKDD